MVMSMVQIRHVGVSVHERLVAMSVAVATVHRPVVVSVVVIVFVFVFVLVLNHIVAVRMLVS